MTAQEIIDYTRQYLLRDYALPYLWNDDLLLMRLNDAYERFCRETYVALDNQTFTVSLEAGTDSYELDETILLVKSVRLDGGTTDLVDRTRHQLPDPNTASTGTPIAFATDEAAGYIRFYPTPDTAVDAVDATLRCVSIYPELAFEDTPRIPKRYHASLADGIAARCFMDNDADGENNTAAKNYEDSFEVFLSQAKHDTYRLRTGANPVIRQNWTGKRG